MSKYNTGKKYNFSKNNGGTKYNSSMFFVLINVFETIKANDSIKEITAKNILKETVNIFDELTQFALHEYSDSFKAYENHSVSTLQKVADKINIKEVLEDTLVSLYLHDKVKALDEFKSLEAIISEKEEVNLEDINSISALAKVAEQFNLKDAEKILVAIAQYEYAKVTDKQPRKSVSDFVIGSADELDKAYEYFLPLQMMFDPEKSNIQVMPGTETTYIDMPYVDGSIMQDTVYKNRMFNIVAWSKDGMTTAQKEQIKADITQLLDSCKNKSKKLTIQRTGISFDVRYSGTAEIKEGASFVKATMPFEMQPYGYPQFDQEVFGTGLIVNGGDKDVGAVNVISGGCANPSFQIGDIMYIWNGTVPINQKLVIDHSRLDCWLEDNNGKKFPALDKLTGEFQIIPRGKTVQITAFGNTNNYLKTTLREKILWKK